MRNHDKIVPIWLDTIEAFEFDQSINPYFDFLEKLVTNGYVITIYRDGIDLNSPLQTIRDIDHIRNFIKHYKKAIGVK